MSATPPIRTLLVANRGEIALRVFRTCRELGIATVAVVAPDDRGSLRARPADTTVEIAGYLDPAEHVRAAREAGADAIHPGYGFLSENGDFAEAVEAAGLVSGGPPPAAPRGAARASGGPPRSSTRRSRRPGTRPRPPSATVRSSASAISSGRATSRCSCSPTRPGPWSPSASAGAPCRSPARRRPRPGTRSRCVSTPRIRARSSLRPAGSSASGYPRACVSTRGGPPGGWPGRGPRRGPAAAARARGDEDGGAARGAVRRDGEGGPRRRERPGRPRHGPDRTGGLEASRAADP